MSNYGFHIACAALIGIAVGVSLCKVNRSDNPAQSRSSTQTETMVHNVGVESPKQQFYVMWPRDNSAAIPVKATDRWDAASRSGITVWTEREWLDAKSSRMPIQYEWGVGPDSKVVLVKGKDGCTRFILRDRGGPASFAGISPTLWTILPDGSVFDWSSANLLVDALIKFGYAGEEPEEAK